MKIDIDRLSAAELDALIRDAEGLRDRLKQKQIGDVRQRCAELAAAEGLSMAELFPELGTTRGVASAKRLPAKYRNPGDPTQTWSGRGTRPAWFKAALQAGKAEDELRV
ncbi:H-NS histone family protein [Chitinimonas koreensis]|uniref:H-NS histone family protein n=1 Tax=Chitinimonas koreensis TaxID=356302 RepID=UPI00048B8E44|nr:H-NS histone family protein [Chitinimonas koreensis]QNM96764.1 H-NS histone family protein [Chitinimonas koreensis]